PGGARRPAAPSYYPDGATKAELERWMQALSEPERARATGFFTTIRRGGTGFTIVPCSAECQPELAGLAALLRRGAATTTNATLKNFLTRRANALLSNDYYDSD